jgi:uncharacterized protein YdhG (YjbR/CyaY superfamily)
MLTIQTIDAYIAQFDEPTQAILRHVREAVRTGAPEAAERISYGMPTLWNGENIIHFAAAKKHIGLYPTPSGIEAFTDRLSGYDQSKGAVRFPLGKPIPYALITEIAAFRAREAAEKRKK